MDVVFCGNQTKQETEKKTFYILCALINVGYKHMPHVFVVVLSTVAAG